LLAFPIFIGQAFSLSHKQNFLFIYCIYIFLNNVKVVYQFPWFLTKKNKINFHDLDYLSYIQRLSIDDTGIAALEIDPNWQLHPILTRTTSVHTRHHIARNNITHPNSPSLSFSHLSRRSTHHHHHTHISLKNFAYSHIGILNATVSSSSPSFLYLLY
jgi:hypothetical protein